MAETALLAEEQHVAAVGDVLRLDHPRCVRTAVVQEAVDRLRLVLEQLPGILVVLAARFLRALLAERFELLGIGEDRLEDRDLGRLLLERREDHAARVRGPCRCPDHVAGTGRFERMEPEQWPRLLHHASQVVEVEARGRVGHRVVGDGPGDLAHVHEAVGVAGDLHGATVRPAVALPRHQDRATPVRAQRVAGELLAAREVRLQLLVDVAPEADADQVSVLEVGVAASVGQPRRAGHAALGTGQPLDAVGADRVAVEVTLGEEQELVLLGG